MKIDLSELRASITETHVFFLKGPLSQWISSPFEEKGNKFANCEQYMMYRKAVLFEDEVIAKQILEITSPSVCKRLGRRVANFDEQTWEAHREDIVFQGNLLKFQANDHLRDLLLATEGKILVEVNPRDTIWGIGLAVGDPEIYDSQTWRGLNLLGKTLMRVRDTLSTPS